MLLEQLLYQLNESLTQEEKKCKPMIAKFLSTNVHNFNEIGENYKNILFRVLLDYAKRYSKKDNISLYNAVMRMFVFNHSVMFIETLLKIVDYLASRPNIQYGVSFNELNVKQNEWHEELKQKKLKKQEIPIDPERIVYREGDYYIYKLANKAECEYDGDYVGHCVGNYGKGVESGNTNIYSLRDKDNKPITSIEITNGDVIKQIYGDGPKTGNVSPTGKHQEVIINWILKEKIYSPLEILLLMWGDLSKDKKDKLIYNEYEDHHNEIIKNISYYTNEIHVSFKNRKNKTLVIDKNTGEKWYND